MGIVVKYKPTGMVLFLCKGAENVMRDIVKPTQRVYILEKSENLAIEGLRTLVMCQKVMTIQDYNTWSKEYKKAIVDYKYKDFL